jgi:hypothetical protein
VLESGPPAPGGRYGGVVAKGMGCRGIGLAALGVVGGAGILAVVGVLVAAVVTGPSAGGAATATPASGGAGSGAAARPGVPGLVVPAPLGPTLDAAGARDVAAAVRRGACRRNDVERTRPSYLTAMRGHGAAGALRGRVAIVHVKMSAAGVTWTPTSERSVTLVAAASRDWLIDQARRWRVDDLAIDSIEWPLATRFAMPPIRLDARGRVVGSDGENLRHTTRAAMEAALGRPLDGVVEELRRRGYANVAFVVHYPGGRPGVRDFAVPVGSPGAAAELAYVLEPDWNVASRSLLVVHELLHLFGADDLYEVRGVAPDDVNDIMNAECDGLGPTHVGATTAYAVGWTASPPRRAYGFSAR